MILIHLLLTRQVFLLLAISSADGLVLHAFAVSFLLSYKPQIVTLSISTLLGIVSHIRFLQILSHMNLHTGYCKSLASHLSPVICVVYCSLCMHSLFLPAFVSDICNSSDRQTVDQKPHKCAPSSPDRMCSGYLLKTAVKVSPLTLMFHFNRP